MGPITMVNLKRIVCGKKGERLSFFLMKKTGRAVQTQRQATNTRNHQASADINLLIKSGKGKMAFTINLSSKMAI